MSMNDNITLPPKKKKKETLFQLDFFFERGDFFLLHPHVLNVLGMQMRSCLHMQSSHVPTHVNE